MLAGIGIVITLKQIPHAFGYEANFEGELSFIQSDGHNTISELFYMLIAIAPNALLVAIFSLVIILAWDNIIAKKYSFFKLLPGSIVVVVFGVLYQLISSAYWPDMALAKSHLVNVHVTNSVEEVLALFTFPDFTQIFNSEVYVVAITLALVASLETLLSVEATDKLDPHKRVTPTNRELLAQGTGNIVSGLIGGLPVTQVIVRSSANVQSGGQSKLSAIMHAIMLMLLVLFLPHIIQEA
jgi:MFS superfamily sulfate permease-like transporter